MATAEMNLEVSVGVTVRPGDTLIVCCPSPTLTAQNADDIKRRLKAKLPDLADVLILGGAVSVATYRPVVALGEDNP